MSKLAAVLMIAAPAFAGEYAVLATGFRIPAERHEVAGQQADGDDVDLTNLQRQILHHVHDVGRPKVQSAVETIADLNPDVKVIPYNRGSREYGIRIVIIVRLDTFTNWLRA